MTYDSLDPYLYKQNSRVWVQKVKQSSMVNYWSRECAGTAPIPSQLQKSPRASLNTSEVPVRREGWHLTPHMFICLWGKFINFISLLLTPWARRKLVRHSRVERRSSRRACIHTHAWYAKESRGRQPKPSHPAMTLLLRTSCPPGQVKGRRCWIRKNSSESPSRVPTKEDTGSPLVFSKQWQLRGESSAEKGGWNRVKELSVSPTQPEGTGGGGEET